MGGGRSQLYRADLLLDLELVKLVNKFKEIDVVITEGQTKVIAKQLMYFDERLGEWIVAVPAEAIRRAERSRDPSLG